MAIIPLYTTYRSHTFDDVVEQENVVRVLQNQIQTNTIRNSYLFVGPSGTGKTTIGRILARTVNKGEGGLTEMDAASNNGVEDVRRIIDKANYQALDAEYKIFIVDECFHKDTLISTDKGYKKISEIKVGDYVENLCGLGRVNNTFKNKVDISRLCIVTINGKATLTTVDELYFTEEGWVEAQHLRNGEKVYSKEYMHKLWKSVLLVHRKEMLLKGMCKDQISKKCYEEKIDEELQNLWKGIPDYYKFFSSDLFKGMRSIIEKSKFGIIKDERTIAENERFLEENIRTNEIKESNEQPRNNRKNEEYSEGEWESLFYSERWKWELYKTSVNSLEDVEPEIRIRVSNTNENEQRLGVSYQLQSRPRMERDKVGDRGGWCFPQIERSFAAGYKEDGIFEEYRVDSVEIYKRGYNDELFSSYISDTDSREGFTYLYDLEVEGHNSYFANDILVHNCHMLSISAWNAFLKTLEEPPAKAIFIFCTTDPQKIPATILNRVQRFDLTRISYNGVFNRLKYIVSKENEKGRGIVISDEVLDYIAKLANGGMRDAISMLDKCLSLKTELTLKDAVNILGSVDYDVLLDLFFSMYNCKESEVIKIIDDLYNNGRDLKLFIRQYTNFLADICKYKLFGNFDYVSIPKLYESQLERAKNSDGEILKHLLDKVNELNSKIKYESVVLPVVETELLLLSRE